MENLNEYIADVVLKLLSRFDNKITKYVGLDANSMEEMISSKMRDGEIILNFPGMFNKGVDECWENDESVDEAVEYFYPGVHKLVYSQASVM